MLNYIVSTATPFGLRLSPTKCELICFHKLGTVDKSSLPQIVVGGHPLKWKTSVRLSSLPWKQDRWGQKHYCTINVSVKLFCPHPPRAPPGTSLFLRLPRPFSSLLIFVPHPFPALLRKYLIWIIISNIFHFFTLNICKSNLVNEKGRKSIN